MTRVKVCGLTNLEDALAAAEVGADLLGFVLVASSPRAVEPGRAWELVAALRARGVLQPCVGVAAGVDSAGARVLLGEGLDLLQVHGAEGAAVAVDIPGTVIVARQVSGAASLEGLAGLPAFACLLDARGVERQGTAAPWDWRLLEGARIRGRVIVAGGLRAGNVAEAVRAARPWGVDVASGVESAPGRKDQRAVARFIRAVREADSE